MTTVIWTDAALRDLDAVRAYLHNFNPRAAIETAAQIIDAANSLATFPARGRALPGSSLREWTLAHPYLIRYRVTPSGDVQVLRVRHGMRRQ